MQTLESLRQMVAFNDLWANGGEPLWGDFIVFVREKG